LGQEDVFLLDGGTGEELFRKGVPDDRQIWSATAIVHSEYHQILQEVHTSFLQAGAQAITTNSYGIVPGVGFDNDEDRSKYMDLAGRIARRAVTESGKKNVFVLGSLGPLVESYRADLIRPHDQGVQEYRIACQGLGLYVDAFLAETMSCVEESMQALEAVMLETNGEIPVLVSYTLDSRGHLRDGQVVTDGLRRLLDHVQKKNNIHCKCASLSVSLVLLLPEYACDEK
jgi:S-methylmethionine-dependent homocysteine/selenocysteine methylase